MARRPLIRDSTQEWRAIAKGPNVLYHIFSTPSQRENGWDEEEFYDAGKEHWKTFLSHWQHYDPTLGGRCVEIGCGAGRLTAALESFFDHVDALDVSEDMITLARAATGDRASFHQVSSSHIPLDDSTADAVFTVHVLQHLDDRNAIESYLDESFRVLRPGGSLMAHIMVIGGQPSTRKKLTYRAKLAKSRWALSRGREHSAVRMVLPGPMEAMRMVRRAQFADVELRAFPVEPTGGLHSFFFGRKPL